MPLDLPRPLALNWNLSELHGWGLVGVHTALYLLDNGVPPLLLAPPALDSMRPAVRQRIEPLVEDQRRMAALMEQADGHPLYCPGHDVLCALGRDFVPAIQEQTVLGVRTIGVIAGEETSLSDAVIERARGYEKIVIHSSYMYKLLRLRGLSRVGLAFQGVDPTEFSPGPRQGWFAGRFAIFSGGKLEFRKGQDIVLAAFRRFHQRHPDALLVTAWGNIWPGTGLNMAESPHCPAPPRIADGALLVEQWALENGLAPGSFVNVGLRPRDGMAALIRECDLAVFPNRCEAGTNLVAMETMACGVPCILSANTGHMDLIAPDRCYALEQQQPVPDHDGTRLWWGESSVEELVAAMEHAYTHREEAAARGAAGAAFILGERTWANFARTFVAACTA